MRAPLVVRDRKYLFSEDIIVDKFGARHPNLRIVAKVSSVIEFLRLGGSYELVYQLWAQFTLSAVRVNTDVTWSRVEFLVSISNCSVMFKNRVCLHFVACLVRHSQEDVSSDFVPLHQLGKITRELQRANR